MSRNNNITSQVLHGKTLEVELLQRRAELEPPVMTARDALEEAATQVEYCAVAVTSGSQADAPAEGYAEVILAEASAALADGYQTVRDAETTRDLFAAQHGQTRQAVLPDVLESSSKTAFTALLEAAFNAGFLLTSGLAANLAEAVALSVAISVANVGVSSLAGYLPGRHLAYGADAQDADVAEYRQVRTLARVQFVLLCLVLVLIHSTAGLIRAQETLHDLDRSLAAHWQLLGNANSVLLIVIGVAISIWTYTQAKSAYNDPYPGFGERERAVRSAQAALVALAEHYERAIAAYVAERRAALSVIEHKAQAAHAAHRHAIEGYRRAERALGVAISEAEAAMRLEAARLGDLLKARRGRPAKKTALANPEALITFQAFEPVEARTYTFAEPPVFADASAALDRLETRMAKALVALLPAQRDDE